MRVTCAIPEGSVRPIGVYALATVAEEMSNLPGVYHRFRSNKHFSALQLVWLATDRGFEGRGLGSLMVGQVIRKFAEVGNQIGLPHLIVIPANEDHERLMRFYSLLGFSAYNDEEGMFLSLQSATDAIEKVQAAAEA